MWSTSRVAGSATSVLLGGRTVRVWSSQTRPATRGQIVYLSHDEGDGHGWVLADDIGDLIKRWLPLGFPGGDDFQLEPFTSDWTTMIDPASDTAQMWIALLGIEHTEWRTGGPDPAIANTVVVP